MKRMSLVPTALWVLLGPVCEAAAELTTWRLGGQAGDDWQERTALNLMVDVAAAPGSLQPLELDPETNVVLQVGPWVRHRQPSDLEYRIGMPRIWYGVGDLIQVGHGTEPLDFVDGDLESFYADSKFSGGGPGGAWGEFYTLDLGLRVPADRFVLVPPEGVDPFNQEPYRPNYTFDEYELTASADPAAVNAQVPGEGCGREGCRDSGYYIPLDVPLASSSQNFDPVIDISFPLQYLQIFRMRPIPEGRRFDRFAIAELEVYGRGFVPEARWESVVVDLEQVVNIGQVSFAVSRWRRQGDQLVAAPEAPAAATVAVKTGQDSMPIAYLGYNDLQLPIEVTEKEYDRLKPRVFPWDPPTVGWRGPMVEDEENWSFWSAPLRTSGQRPLVGKGQYLQLQVELSTDGLWEFARLDSLAVQYSPLLAEQIVGEVALVGDLQPQGGLVRVEAGTTTEFVYDMRAEFGAAGQAGFDAVRVLAPSPAEFLSLEMGEPLTRVDMGPGDVVPEEMGFVVHLPRRIERGGDSRLRIRLETAVYGAAARLRSEVFERQGDTLPQEVEAGDASDELGTNGLQVLALETSLGTILGGVTTTPAVLTPQGDGVNDAVDIEYVLLQVLGIADVDVEVFRLSGERVRRLAHETKGAGRHRVAWDGRDDRGDLVAPGIYLVRVEVNADTGRRARVLPLAVAY